MSGRRTKRTYTDDFKKQIVNLYNNGFAGGIVSIVMFPILSKYIKPNVYSDPSPSMMMSKLKDIDKISDMEKRLSDMEKELSNLW